MRMVHKIALDPNNKQETYFRKAAGTARFAYNWALAEWEKQYAEGGQPSEISLRRYLNYIKEEFYPWMAEVSKNVIQQAIKNLGAAYQNFFSRLAERKRTGNKRIKLGYPKFKKKGRCTDSFRADGGPATKGADAVRVDGRYTLRGQ